MRSIMEYRESELTDEVAQAIARLTAKCFTNSSRTWQQRLQAMRSAATSQDPEETTSRRFLIWQAGLPVAHARTFVRRVKNGEREIPVLALAAVCSDPSVRGQGLGGQVTRQAWRQVGQPGWPEVSLFQTPVPDFYEKLDARIIANRFVNRLHETQPEANPWRDDTIMIYPARFAWPEGVIDLNGPDY
jgi:predicted N-acetyltransferase YhbS